MIASTIVAAPAASADAGVEGLPPPERAESMIDINRIEGQVRESSVKKVGEVVRAYVTRFGQHSVFRVEHPVCAGGVI